MAFFFRSIQKVLTFFLLIFITGCGVKSNPTHPKESLFPRFYPNADKKFEQLENMDVKRNIGIFEKDFDSFFEYPNNPPKN